ncbi:MAG: HAD family hydrolase [Polyangiales bacterium]
MNTLLSFSGCRCSLRTATVLFASLALLSCASQQHPEPQSTALSDPLPSWNDTEAKKKIVAFVHAVVDRDAASFVPEEERIAVFDNDGTLWVEQPIYTQLAFAVARIRELSAQHPEYKTTQPYKAVLEEDWQAVLKSGTEGFAKILFASHANLDIDAFQESVTRWLAHAMHPRFKRRYTEMVYQPQLELLRYLRANGFKTYIVSGGGTEFLRAWTEPTYGIPPERTIGSTLGLEYRVADGEPELVRTPKIEFNDDKEGKPISIHRYIGRRPIFAFGNSDGDFEMLMWTTHNKEHPTLGMIVHHDDPVREYAYDRESHVGTLDRGLDAAESEGWLIVSMKNDWRSLFSSNAK